MCENCWYFSRVDKTKVSNSAADSFPTAEISLSVNWFSKNTSSRCVLSIHKPGKDDHVIYRAAKVNRQLEKPGKKKRKTNWPTNSRKAKTSSYGRRLINKSSDTFVFCRILFNEQGPRTTYCNLDLSEIFCFPFSSVCLGRQSLSNVIAGILSSCQQLETGYYDHLATYWDITPYRHQPVFKYNRETKSST